MKNRKLGFIGIGNMASAIISGILKSRFLPASDIYMYNPHPEKMADFISAGCIACSSSAEIVQSCSTVFLCIKPQIFPQVLDELKPVTETIAAYDVLFVSIAAGITFKNLQDALGCDRPYIRVMPNTPLLLAEGASAISRTERVLQEDFSRICDIFSCCGTVKEIPEDQMNAVIAVSGSSPAYLYRLAKITCDYAAERGIDGRTALELFCQTLKGSAEMLLHAGRSPEELIDMVTSKGGTTFQLLGMLNDRGFDAMMLDAFDACESRAKELSV